MQHVGNDIVDLTNPDVRRKSQDTRFINRVFTQGEQEQIFGSTNPDVMLWALWAGKESAYKIVSKSYPAVPSVPRAYNVSFDGDVMNSYNDGPLENGGQLGPFYELESSSPAAFLKPGESLHHFHHVFHFTGEKHELNKITETLFGTNLLTIEEIFD